MQPESFIARLSQSWHNTAMISWMGQHLLSDRNAPDPAKKATSRDNLVREASAWAGYRYPKHETFRAELCDLLDHPATASWIQTGKVIQHMTNYHRCKLLKHYPELFSDFTMFNLMLNAFVAEDEIAEFALAYVPRLINTRQYQELLSSIPEKEIDSFIERSLDLLSFPLETDKIDLIFYPEVKEYFQEEESEINEESVSTPSLKFLAALAGGSAGTYYLTENHLLSSAPVLYGLYLMYAALSPPDNTPSQLTEFSLWSPSRSHREPETASYRLARLA